MATFDSYRQLMVDYYDQASRLAYVFQPGELARQYDAVYAEEGSWMRDLAVAMQRMARGRRVLEIASGHGRWTRYLVESAASVLATDASERMLDQARQLVRAGRGEWTRRCRFEKLDAFAADRLSERFDCIVAVNFFQHIPVARQQTFIDAIARTIVDGGEVMLAVNRLHRRTRELFFQKAGEEDWFDLRLLPGGSVYEIIDNPFEPARMRQVLEGRADRVRFTRGAKFDWVTYRVRHNAAGNLQ